MFQHKSGSQKQQNKSHHTKFSSKGAIKKQSKGKVEAKDHVSLKKATKVESRVDRKSKQKQFSQAKKDAVLAARRYAAREGPPKLIGVVHLGSEDSNVYSLLLQHCGIPDETDTSAPTTVCVGKSRFTFIDAARDANVVLDVAKVADILLLVVPAETGIDATGERIITLIKAQGVPSVIGIIEGLESVPLKKRNDVKKSHIKTIHFHFPSEPKVLLLEKAEEAANVMRMIEVAGLNVIHWRQNRPYMLVDKVSTADEGELGTVKVSGYLRGGNLSANQLIQIPDLGDFQILKIEGAADPHPAGRGHNEMDSNNTMLDVPDPEQQESLETENEPDLLNNEQTWPTIEELIQADEKRKKKKKLVPKGMSSYQASWLVDEEEGSDGEDNMNDEEHGDDESDKSDWEELQDDDDNKSVMSEKKKREDDEDEWEFDFPDEVAAPSNMPARIRFQRFRGLKSFRTSPWDPKENLPLEYGRIFQFESFNRSMKTALEDSKSYPVETGSYITIHIAAVPLSFVKLFNPTIPLVIGGLFKYENKISVLHFHITKHTSYTETVKSKANLIFHVGLRRFAIRPLFSESAPNCDKQKLCKELLPGPHPIVASIFGPITFPPAPLLVFTPAGDLVATGSLIEVNPDRIITKRIVLTGKAFKVHKRSAVIREMFYFPEDIEWFKPVDLWTKHGRNGNIKESLGTHGNMKCVFDKPISQADSICLSLYKRCFPKWPEQSYSKQYLNTNNNNNNNTTNTTSDNEEEEAEMQE